MAITDESYYKLRKEIRKLYKNDVRLNGDLCSKILEIRDKNKCVESISVALSDYSISIEVTENTPQQKVDSIVSTVMNKLSEFISNNASELTVESLEDFNNFIKPENYLLCDCMVIGSSINICL